jgi:hypothetical protein
MYLNQCKWYDIIIQTALSWDEIFMVLKISRMNRNL